MSVADRSMGLGLRALAASPAATWSTAWACASPPSGSSTAPAATASAARPRPAARSAPRRSSARPARPPAPPPRACSTSPPTTSSRCCSEAMRELRGGAAAAGRHGRRRRLRGARRAARAGRASSGSAMLGVPEELGGVGERALGGDGRARRRGAGARRHGPRRRRCSRPSGVSTALALWGDADQQATYLPPFVGEDVPAAALALLGAAAAVRPVRAGDHGAARRDGGYVLSGVKSLVPRAASAELFLVAAQLEDRGPGAVPRRVRHRRAWAPRPSPRWACAPPRPAALTLDDVGRARERAARGRRPGRVRRGRAARPPRLVRAGGRHRRRPCSTT